MKKQLPLLKPGQRVLHKITRQTGTVVLCINENDSEDVKAQGYRYEVSMLRGTYSVLGQNLYRK